MKKVVGRASDERLLAWIKGRKRGQTVSELGAQSGVTNVQVVVTTNKVRDADIVESGEDVAGCYW